MIYILDTYEDIMSINTTLMCVDNGILSIEHFLERIRICINEYTEYPIIMNMIGDMALYVNLDTAFKNKLMNSWTTVVLKIYYYILHEDMQLPITNLELVGMDLKITTEG